MCPSARCVAAQVCLHSAIKLINTDSRECVSLFLFITFAFIGFAPFGSEQGNGRALMMAE